MLGFHTSKGSSLSMKIAIANNKYDLKTTQIYVAGPQNVHINKEFLQAKPDLNIDNVIVHSNYINSANMWHANEQNIEDIKKEIDATVNVGSKNLVMHFIKDSDVKIDQIIACVEKLVPLFEKRKVNLCLEHIASSRLNDADSWNKFCDKFFKTITSDYVKLVIDTAHLWGSGYNMQSYDDAMIFLQNFKYINKVQILHLNGSSRAFDRNCDKHQMPMSQFDLIWGPEISQEAYNNKGIKAFIEYAILYNWFIILEICRDYSANEETFINILKKALVALPVVLPVASPINTNDNITINDKINDNITINDKIDDDITYIHKTINIYKRIAKKVVKRSVIK